MVKKRQRLYGRTKNAAGVKDGFQSDLERAISLANGRAPHNTRKVRYQRLPQSYTPDFLFRVGDKALMVEAKGLLTPEARAIAIAVQACYGFIAKQLGTKTAELVFCFQNGAGRLNPKNPNSLTYLEWAEKQGFRATDSMVFPDEWFDSDDVSLML